LRNKFQTSIKITEAHFPLISSFPINRKILPNKFSLVINLIVQTNLMKKKRSIIIFLFGLVAICYGQKRIAIDLQSSQPPLLTASAGSDLTTTSGNIQLGGLPAALGGTEPYSYQWLPTTGLNDSTIANPELLANQTQSYSLQITDQRGCTALDTISITILGLPSNTSNESELILFPNPGTGLIQLKFNKQLVNPSATVKVYDSSGKLIKSNSISSLGIKAQLDLSQFSAGTYTISIEDGEKQFTNRFIISR